MPDINGLRLISELRKWGDEVPIIAISGSAPDQLHLAEDYGASEIFYKPVDRDELLQAVARCLESPPPVDPWGRR